jgi:leucyl aminopeptidase (aminopeptidase T)
MDLTSELTHGAWNAVHVCLKILLPEKVTLITDRATLDIGKAMAREIERVGAEHRVWILEEFTSRPAPTMPSPILDDLETSEVSIFAAQAQDNELSSRGEMFKVVNRRLIRHAHMVNITRQIMASGMRADFLKVDLLSRQVLATARSAAFIRARTPAGTDLCAEMDPAHQWLKTSGIISPNTWSNLPGGEVWTTPKEVNGVFVVDGVVGDYLCAKYGDLRADPLTIRVRGNRLVEAHCCNRSLEDEFWRYTHTDENSDRVGEFAIGTNTAVREVIGNILQDEKIPGVHIAFGHPYGEHTGARWSSSTHIDVVGRNFDIWLDDRVIMRNGEFQMSALSPAV